MVVPYTTPVDGSTTTAPIGLAPCLPLNWCTTLYFAAPAGVDTASATIRQAPSTPERTFNIHVSLYRREFRAAAPSIPPGRRDSNRWLPRPRARPRRF